MRSRSQVEPQMPALGVAGPQMLDLQVSLRARLCSSSMFPLVALLISQLVQALGPACPLTSEFSPGPCYSLTLHPFTLPFQSWLPVTLGRCINLLQCLLPDLASAHIRWSCFPAEEAPISHLENMQEETRVTGMVCQGARPSLNSSAVFQNGSKGCLLYSQDN